MSKSTTMHQLDFRVPNTVAGRNFIKLSRKFINRDKWGQVVARTRGPREPGPNTQATQADAIGHALYLRESKQHELYLAKIEANSRDYMDTREFKRVSNEYEGLLKEQRTETASALSQVSAMGSIVIRKNKEIVFFQRTTLACAVVFSIIGYFINA